jgi:hypothetical protein
MDAASTPEAVATPTMMPHDHATAGWMSGSSPPATVRSCMHMRSAPAAADSGTATTSSA